MEEMAMKQFTTAVKAARSEEDTPIVPPVTFKIDDHECTAVFPEPGQFAVLMASMAEYNGTAEAMSGAINFVFALLDDESRRYVKRRLWDKEDDFGSPNILEIVDYLVEEWTGNPTVEASASTSSSSPALKKSTGKRRHSGSTR